jgi:hypothetical protein
MTCGKEFALPKRFIFIAPSSSSSINHQSIINQSSSIIINHQSIIINHQSSIMMNHYIKYKSS